MVDLLIQCENPSAGLYDKELPEDIKEVSGDFNGFKTYSAIIVDIKECEELSSPYEQLDRENMDKIIEKIVVGNIRKDDITMQYGDNKLLIIIPIEKENNLNKLVQRINSAIIEKLILMKRSNSINIGVAFSGDSNIENILNSLQEEAQAEKKKNRFSAFSKETNLSKRIENVRKELYKMIDYFEGRTGGCEVIEMSQYLDELLSEYEKGGRDKYGGK
jgi:hypothetical protein